MRRRATPRALGAALVLPLALAGCSAGSLGSSDSGAAEGVTEISLLVDSSPTGVEPAEALAEAFNAQSDTAQVTVDTRPEGTEGDNLLKTRLATGEMNDMFSYNSGSLFQQLAPTQNLQPMTDEPFMDAVQDSFKEVVSADGDVYGVPMGTTFGGGVLYSVPVYEELGLEVPQTWDEFIANSQAISDSGRAGVIQTYGETWTSQLPILGNFRNVIAANPDWAEQYTANEVGYVDTPAALAGFEHLAQVNELGLLNEDFASAEVVDGLRMLAEGTGGHYPQLSNQVAGLETVAPDAIGDIGFFALPGDDAATYGMTAWFPNGLYVPATTEGPELEAVKEFMAFVVTSEGCDLYSETAEPTGPYPIDGCSLPEDVLPVTQDVQGYFESDDQSPALEFLSPIKGPALEQIAVEVGSGIRSPEDGAALYDQDVEQQAQQLGLPGW